jgi:Trk K+ transport system NAD-binding subunit
MNIIIVGCGRVGSKLAMLFSGRGDDVAVIDMDPDSFGSLGRNFEGRPSSASVLTRTCCAARASRSAMSSLP